MPHLRFSQPSCVHQPRSPGLAGVWALALSLLAVPAAWAQLFTNSATITIPDSGVASPYPSTINVSGVAGTPTGLRVRLNGLTHALMNDVAILLVAPNGQGVQLTNRSGGEVSGISLGFDTDTTTPLTEMFISGLFVPSGGNTSFAAPANAVPRAASLSALLSANVNGAWSLYLQDFATQDQGSIASWTMEFGDFAPLPPVPAARNAFTYQGRLSGGVTNGLINARFTLYNHPTSNSFANQVAGPVTVNGISVQNLLFTATVNFGELPASENKLFLGVEIASPASSPYVALTPRQEITVTPMASLAYSLARTTNVPAGDVLISGPQIVGGGGTLTLRASGADGQNGIGSSGGTVRLVAGNANSASTEQNIGTSLSNNVHIVAGDNVWSSNDLFKFNGNIQFFAGNLQPERMRIVGDNGFVGIGTTAPGQLLDVRGSIALGSNGELRAASATENLRMIRGTITLVGSISAGAGYTVARTGTGAYTVTFDQAFATVPTVTINAFNTAPLFAHVNTTTNTGFTFSIRSTAGTSVDSAANFIVLGPR